VRSNLADLLARQVAVDEVELAGLVREDVPLTFLLDARGVPLWHVAPGQVEIVAVVAKAEAAEWLARWGIRIEEEGGLP
jgi:hypothetical protein